MKHRTVAIRFDDLYERLNADTDTTWRETMALNDDACDALDARWREAKELDAAAEEKLLEKLDTADADLRERLAGTWWCVCWPEHVLSPEYNSDAGYHGPCSSAEECRADCVYGEKEKEEEENAFR